jgi:hypothetical protein
VAAGVWTLAAVVVLRRAGVLAAPLLQDAFVRRATWLSAGLLTLGAVMKAASPSGWERFGWEPVSLVPAASSVVLARSEPVRL